VAQGFLDSLRPLLAPAIAHPLPQPLQDWHDPSESGDYFSQVTPTEAGYLVWSRFPVRVYLALPDGVSVANPPSTDWQAAVDQVVAEWSQYLPLELTTEPDRADITIHLSPPPLRLATIYPASADRPGLPLERARSAETRYELFVDTTAPEQPILAHRCTIWLSPRQTVRYIQAAARHEMGHALGIWGHSPFETDALYAAQVSSPASISVRDVNTLKRIYEHPTQIGWPLRER